MMHRIFAKGRKQLGLSQELAADMFGVSQSTISRWENGTLEIPEDAVNRLGEVLRGHATAQADFMDALANGVEMQDALGALVGSLCDVINGGTEHD